MGLWIFCLTAKTVFHQREYARGHMKPCLPETEHSFKVKCLTCDLNVTVKFFARCDTHLNTNMETFEALLHEGGHGKPAGALLALWKEENEPSWYERKGMVFSPEDFWFKSQSWGWGAPEQGSNPKSAAHCSFVRLVRVDHCWMEVKFNIKFSGVCANIWISSYNNSECNNIFSF